VVAQLNVLQCNTETFSLLLTIKISFRFLKKTFSSILDRARGNLNVLTFDLEKESVTMWTDVLMQSHQMFAKR